MSVLVFILSVLGASLAFGLALWAYAYWHQTTALDAEMKRALEPCGSQCPGDCWRVRCQLGKECVEAQ